MKVTAEVVLLSSKRKNAAQLKGDEGMRWKEKRKRK
jgi:hypothetical protein